ncbi:MAG: hypothetical protein FJ388_20630, partial [Verrucomicrobia bacterium]|nr:hypothetical protein [Verrucomicrobiota bacterium]
MMKHIFTALLLTLLPAATPTHAQTTKKLLPANWDAKQAGDRVMERLICVTAPQVKGAHDAGMVLADDRAYIVAEVNDLRAGEGAGWLEIHIEDSADGARWERKYRFETVRSFQYPVFCEYRG